jgi:predicted nucleic acid-binding protein
LPRWLDTLDALGATIAPLSLDDQPVLDLARRHQLTWSDANWVDVAIRGDLPLVTADPRLIASVQDDVAILADLRDAAA